MTPQALFDTARHDADALPSAANDDSGAAGWSPSSWRSRPARH